MAGSGGQLRRQPTDPTSTKRHTATRNLSGLRVTPDARHLHAIRPPAVRSMIGTPGCRRLGHLQAAGPAAERQATCSCTIAERRSLTPLAGRRRPATWDRRQAAGPWNRPAGLRGLRCLPASTIGTKGIRDRGRLRRPGAFTRHWPTGSSTGP